MAFDSDTLFSALPTEIQRLIDRAFDSIFHQDQNSATTSNNASTGGGGFINDSGGGGFLTGSGGGGFIVDDEFTQGVSTINDFEGGGGGGGFIVETELESTKPPPKSTDQIPLDRVSSALQRLDLPPDDDQILSVFKNAASGWKSGTLKTSVDLDASKEYVSRADWRSVCAVLLDTQGSDATGSDDDDGDAVAKSRKEGDEDVDMDMAQNDRGLDEDEDAGSSDEYAEENLSPLSDVSEDEASEDEYQVMTSSRKRTRGSTAAASAKTTRASGRSTRRRRGVSPSLADPQQMTRRQRQTCIDTYALFFPDCEGEELTEQRIMIKDVQRVAKVLGEKLKAEEMVEMVEMFSSCADKSMNFQDFSRMMMTARLA